MQPQTGRLLRHESELRRLDRGNDAAREVAPHLGVVVEGRSGPADLVAVFDQRLAPSVVSARTSSSVTERIRVATSCSISARSTAGVPALGTGGLAGTGDRGLDLFG